MYRACRPKRAPMFLTRSTPAASQTTLPGVMKSARSREFVRILARDTMLPVWRCCDRPLSIGQSPARQATIPAPDLDDHEEASVRSQAAAWLEARRTLDDRRCALDGSRAARQAIPGPHRSQTEAGAHRAPGHRRTHDDPLPDDLRRATDRSSILHRSARNACRTIAEDNGRDRDQKSQRSAGTSRAIPGQHLAGSRPPGR